MLRAKLKKIQKKNKSPFDTTLTPVFFFFFIFKERWGYICPDIAKEFAKYEAEPAKWIKKYEGVNAITKKVANLIFYYVAFIGN